MIRTFLNIRSVHVLSADGETVDFRRVHCAAQARNVALEQCLSCEQSGGLVRDPVDRIEYASCRHPAAVEAPGEHAGAATGVTPVSAAMTSDLLAVRPAVSLEALTHLLLERGIGGAPVVDEIGRPIGVVSKTDLLGRRSGTGARVVADAMTREAVTVPETAPLSEAAALMSARGIHRVLVVSDDGKVSGILTSEDVVRWFARAGGAEQHPAP